MSTMARRKKKKKAAEVEEEEEEEEELHELQECLKHLDNLPQGEKRLATIIQCVRRLTQYMYDNMP